MKIPGLSVPVPEKTPGETGVNSGSPVQGTDAVSAAAKPEARPVPAERLRAVPLSSSSQTTLFRNLGLPADGLSAAIISFAKFFSLPLEPLLLANIRRQANFSARSADSLGAMNSSAQTGAGGAGQELSASARPALSASAAGTVPDYRELLSFAALAAADKGLELTPAGLEEYAAAIDPDQRGGQNSREAPGRRDRGKKHKMSGEPAAALPKREVSGIRAAGSTQPPEPPESIFSSRSLPHELQKQFLAAAENNPLLDILNRLPGKNGQRWLVLPFSFAEEEAQYRITLRILLNREIGTCAFAVCRTSLEIVKKSPPGGDSHWLFIMDRGKEPAEEGEGQYRLTVMLKPPRRPGSLKSLAKKLSVFMEIPPDRITVKNYGDSSAGLDGYAGLDSDSRHNLFDSVDKEI